jgi:hypothetical protein
LKAKYIYWYLSKLEDETLRSDYIFQRLQSRSFLTEEEVSELIKSNGRINSYVRLMKEYMDFETSGWRYRLFHRRKQNML